MRSRRANRCKPVCSCAIILQQLDAAETRVTDILIIGGGIGGLTLALSLHANRVPARVRIYEAASDIKALGVGINLGPHAVKELAALGLEDQLVSRGCTPQDYAFFTRHGQLVYREPWGRAAGHQWPHLSIHRAELHDVLLSAVRDRLGDDCFHAGHRCVGFEQGVSLANRIHSSGRAVVWSGHKEQAEHYWEQLQGHGLTMAPLERTYPAVVVSRACCSGTPRGRRRSRRSTEASCSRGEHLGETSSVELRGPLPHRLASTFGLRGVVDAAHAARRS